MYHHIHRPLSLRPSLRLAIPDPRPAALARSLLRMESLSISLPYLLRLHLRSPPGLGTYTHPPVRRSRAAGQSKSTAQQSKANHTPNPCPSFTRHITLHRSRSISIEVHGPSALRTPSPLARQQCNLCGGTHATHIERRVTGCVATTSHSEGLRSESYPALASASSHIYTGFRFGWSCCLI